MITDFVRDGCAWFRCEECGAEDTILKYEFVPQYDFPLINHEKTIAGIEVFKMKHALCKKIDNQLELLPKE